MIEEKLKAPLILPEIIWVLPLFDGEALMRKLRFRRMVNRSILSESVSGNL